MTDRPTHEERADAADRLIEKVDAARHIIWEAQRILRERRRESGSTRYPLFIWGERLDHYLDGALEPLSKAHREAAIQGYDEHRAATKSAADGVS
jgi:hypothetical protein